MIQKVSLGTFNSIIIVEINNWITDNKIIFVFYSVIFKELLL